MDSVYVVSATFSLNFEKLGRVCFVHSTGDLMSYISRALRNIGQKYHPKSYKYIESVLHT